MTARRLWCHELGISKLAGSANDVSHGKAGTNLAGGRPREKARAHSARRPAAALESAACPYGRVSCGVERDDYGERTRSRPRSRLSRRGAHEFTTRARVSGFGPRGKIHTTEASRLLLLPQAHTFHQPAITMFMATFPLPSIFRYAPVPIFRSCIPKQIGVRGKIPVRSREVVHGHWKARDDTSPLLSGPRSAGRAFVPTT